MNTFYLCFLLFASSIADVFYYANSVAGSDTNDCLTFQTPCASLDGALLKDANNKTIYLAAGQYLGGGGVYYSFGVSILGQGQEITFLNWNSSVIFNQLVIQDVTLTGWTAITTNPMLYGVNSTTGIGYSLLLNRVTFRDFSGYDIIGAAGSCFGNITIVDSSILRVTITHFGFIYLNNGYLLSPYYFSIIRTTFLNCTGSLVNLYGTGTPISYAVTNSSVSGTSSSGCIFCFTGFLRGAQNLPNFLVQFTNTDIVSNSIYNGSVFNVRTGYPGYNNSVGATVTLTNVTICNNYASVGFYPEITSALARGSDGSVTVIGGLHQSLGDFKSNFFSYSIQGASDCTNYQSGVTIPPSSTSATYTYQSITNPIITNPPVVTTVATNGKIVSHGTVLELSFLLVVVCIYFNRY